MQFIGNEFCIETKFSEICENGNCPEISNFENFEDFTDHVYESYRKDENFRKSQFLSVMDFFETFFEYHHRDMLWDLKF